MNTPKIEQLITKAIENRPKITNAPMNLYIFWEKLVCGARSVMPEEAVFVAHVTPDHLENGFSNREWQLIVEKIANTMGKETLKEYGDGQTDGETAAKSSKRVDFTERRREQRLRYQSTMWFGENFSKKLQKAVMRDVSSGGLAFTCHTEDKCLKPGRKVVARFSVPCFASKNYLENMDFDRVGSVCRVEQANSSLERVAIQFTKPLPFRPGEQYSEKLSDSKVGEMASI
jgi:hypothetical protein